MRDGHIGAVLEIQSARLTGSRRSVLASRDRSACTSVPKSDMPQARFADLARPDLDSELAVW